MPEFIQLIEYRTTRIDEIQAAMDEWLRRTEGRRTAASAVICADRDQPGRYFDIVRFPSYEEAMRNSNLPETTEISEQWAKLCDEGPFFTNLDVVREELG